MTQETSILIDDAVGQELMELTDGAAAPCFQCGVCTAVCPWGRVREEPLSVRSILRAVQLGHFDQLEPLWLCTGCRECELSCPRGVPIAEVLRSIRYLLWEQRKNLDNLPAVLWSMYWNGNPLSQPPSARSTWAAELALPAFDHRHPG